MRQHVSGSALFMGPFWRAVLLSLGNTCIFVCLAHGHQKAKVGDFHITVKKIFLWTVNNSPRPRR